MLLVGQIRCWWEMRHLKAGTVKECGEVKGEGGAGSLADEVFEDYTSSLPTPSFILGK